MARHFPSLHLKNIIFNIDGSINNFKLHSNNVVKNNLHVDGVIVKIENNEVLDSLYYGSDFSAFYVSWKTGKIGLKVLDGKGFYQGKVTEEVLDNKGYTKKEA